MQHWFRSRKNDDKGVNFYKIQAILNPSIKHNCEHCVFSENCSHECCLKLVYFTYQQKIFTNEEISFNPSFPCKRLRSESPDFLEGGDDDGLVSKKQEYLIDEVHSSFEEDGNISEEELLQPLTSFQTSGVARNIPWGGPYLALRS